MAEALGMIETRSFAAVVEAADAAVKGAKPMTQNGYKVQIAHTAVKRAILKAGGIAVV